MLGFYIAFVIVMWIAISFFLFDKATNGGWVCGVVLFVWVVIAMGFVIQSDIEQDKEHPCVEYEIRQQYNPATKTVMPVKVCALRGEWVEDK